MDSFYVTLTTDLENPFGLCMIMYDNLVVCDFYKLRRFEENYVLKIDILKLITFITSTSLAEAEKSIEMLPDMEYISEIRNVTKLPTKVNVSLPTPIPKPIDHENLHNFFGQIIPSSTATQEHIHLQELLDEPVLVKKIQTRYEYLSNITCLNGEQMWTSGENSNIKFLNTKGSRLKTIQTKSK